MGLDRVIPELLLAASLAVPLAAQEVPFTGEELAAGPVSVSRTDSSVTVSWPDEADRLWSAVFSLDPDDPLITSIGTERGDVVRGVRPFYQAETGTRSGGWNAFFDFPPAHPDGTRRWQADFEPREAVARAVGNRVELYFDGLGLGPFDGGIAYTFYPGSRLVHQEAVVTTTDPDVAYYYDAGWEMDAASDRTPGNNMATRVSFYDTSGQLREVVSTGFDPERKPEQVRYRTLAVETAGGSVAVFPAPHQYFFPRDFTSNLGYLWHRSWRGRVSLGIRQLRETNWQFYPWMNAPPGTEQRMSVFFVLSNEDAGTNLDDVLRFTRGDRFAELDGYKTLSTHWHFAYTEQALAHGLDWTPPFKPVLEKMGVDASVIMDFHGDGHPRDLTDLRLEELDAYFRALRAQSDSDFLLIPGEEANVHLGGHWALIFPRPVYWYMARPPGGAFQTTHPRYGTVYSADDAEELLEIVRREGGYMYQTHPRTKGSTGYPDRIFDTPYFRDPSYLGAGWKALPSDPSSPRLGDRAFDLLDDMSNQGMRKLLLGEVDVFQLDETHELYAHMNVNYVRLDELPDFDHFGAALEPLARGAFFTTTGEVLLPNVDLMASTDDRITADVQVEWTFPLRSAEIVWGDGAAVHRENIPLTETGPFGSQRFEWTVPATGWKWARVAVWDVATNGAFVNPVWRD